MISPVTLQDQVKNTASFIFDEKPSPRTRYIEVLSRLPAAHGVEFFEFCIAAHFATVGTFVPTDVDNAIREKLWLKRSPQDLEAMWALVQEFLTWDESLVSKRFVISPSGLKLSGHQGEWFTIAVAAYATGCKPMKEKILSVVRDHEQALKELRENAEEEPKKYLDGIAAVAHNLGDLNRMIEAWKLEKFYNSETPEFLLAGKIYQELLANENHRHYPLREPKCIRKSKEYLLNFGPFLDEWGERLVKSHFTGKLNEGEIREVAEALIQGWKRLNPKSIYTSQGYARALAGMEKTFPRGRADFEKLLSPGLVKQMNEGGLRTLMNISRAQFEKQWVGKLFRLLDSSSNIR